MENLRSMSDLFAYNSWANGLVFTACQGMDQAQLRESAPGTHGTIEETLKHMVGVEEVYLHLLRDKPIDSVGSQEEYFKRDLAWLGERAEQLGDEYEELVASAAPPFYDEKLKLPWFDFDLTKHDGLLQVLTHSAQHRAQVFSTLGARGLEVPNVDYVQFVQVARAGTR